MSPYRSSVLLLPYLICLGLFSLALSEPVRAEVSVSSPAPLQSSPSTPWQTLKLGTQGEKVTELQKMLKTLKLYQGAGNGVFTEETALAVRRFQKANNLRETGIVSAGTWQRMQTAVAKQVGKSSASATAPGMAKATAKTTVNQAKPFSSSPTLVLPSSLQAVTAEATPTPVPAPQPKPKPPSRRWLLLLAIAGLTGTGAIGALSFFLMRHRGKPPTAIAPHDLSVLDMLDADVEFDAPLAHAHEEFAGEATSASVAGAEPDTTSLEPPTPEPQSPPAPQLELPPVADPSTPEFSSQAAPAHEAMGVAASDALSPQAFGSHRHEQPGQLAIGETTRLAKVDILEELVKDLYNPDPATRRKAIWELGQRGNSQVVPPLVDLMASSDSVQRSLILAALSEIGTRTLKPMNRALAISLQDENPDVRKNAIRDLTRIYDLIAQISQLLHHASYDPDTEVQETARWAMSQLGRIRSSKAPGRTNGDATTFIALEDDRSPENLAKRYRGIS